MSQDRIRVAFVDDEAHHLQDLRKRMLAMLDDWEMSFFKDPVALLWSIQDKACDVVVADLRMPEMDGSKLLDEISKRHPEIIRVVLAGPDDAASVFRTVGPAHVYLPKPCDPGRLRQAIQSRLTLRALMNGSEMRRLLGSLNSLPSAPQMFFELIELLRSPQASAQAVAGVIRRDMAMTAELLKLTNASHLRGKGSVTTPLQAVRILGLEIVQTLVLQLGIFRQFQGSAELNLQVVKLNEYSQNLGHLAESVAIAAGESDATARAAHCAALLSAIGALVLLSEKPAEYQTTLARVNSTFPLHQAEAEKFGAGHALIGGYLLGLWGFADNIVEAVTFSGRPTATAGGPNPVLTALHVARALGPSFPLLDQGQGNGVVLDLAYLSAAGQTIHLESWYELAKKLA